MTDESLRCVTVLGSTGSVGRATLDLIACHPDRFTVEALCAGRDARQLAAQARQCGAKFAAVADDAAYGTLKAELSGSGIAAASGPQAIVEAASRPAADRVVAAIVGVAGLLPILAAIRRGAVVILANKECLVSAGPLMMDAARESGAVLLPADSEHNAIFQVFETRNRNAVGKLILTASGGPFHTASREQMAKATPEDALRHPVWDMGAKISIDSATMMNKGLEIIEAHHLFAMPEERIEVLVHPQSVVHSMVAYIDGSVLAQLGTPDMRTPIAQTLAWPGRMAAPVASLDLGACGDLTFMPPDLARFPALDLCREALKTGDDAPAVVNAANEVAVAAFLKGEISFPDIVDCASAVLAGTGRRKPDGIDAVLDSDRAAREAARAHIAG